MAEKFITVPAADLDGNNLPTTLANAILSDTTSISGLTNATSYRSFVLQNPSDAFAPAGASGFTEPFTAADSTVFFSGNGDYTRIVGDTSIEDRLIVTSNQLTKNTNSSTTWGYLRSGYTAPDDQYAELTAVEVGDNSIARFRLYLRATNASNCYRVDVGPGTGRAYKIVAGVQTELGPGSRPAAISNGDVVKFEAQGTTLRLYVNGSLSRTYTDSEYASGSIGVGGDWALVTSVRQIMDNFNGGPV